MEQQRHRGQQHGTEAGRWPEQTAGTAVSDVGEGTRQTASDAWSEVSDFVRCHPIAYLAASGGLGLLLMRSMASQEPGSRGSLRERSQQQRYGEDRPFSHGGLGHGQGSSGSGSHGMAEQARELASTVTEKAGDVWHGTQRMASTVASGTGDAWTAATGYGRDYPLVTFAVGAGLGFALAHLLGGKWLPESSSKRSQWEGGRSGGGI